MTGSGVYLARVVDDNDSSIFGKSEFFTVEFAADMLSSNSQGNTGDDDSADVMLFFVFGLCVGLCLPLCFLVVYVLRRRCNEKDGTLDDNNQHEFTAVGQAVATDPVDKKRDRNANILSEPSAPPVAVYAQVTALDNYEMTKEFPNGRDTHI